jgi:hypothetical protein
MKKCILFSIFFCVLLNSIIFAQKVDNSAAKSMKEAGISHQPVTIEGTLTDYLNEGFEGGVVPPSGWTAVINNAYTWQIHTLDPYSGIYAADVEYDPALIPQDEWLVSPSLDLSSVTSALVLKFYWNTSYYWFVDPFNNADVFMKISSDGGSTWNTLWSEDSVGVFTNWEWYPQELDISSYGGQSNVKIALNYVGVDAAQFITDEISLYSIAGPGQATNPNPTNGATGVDVTNLVLSWTNPSGATLNEVWFGTPGNLTQIHSGSLVSAVNAPSPLNYFTVYNWRVDEIDGTGTTTGPVWSFTTVQDPNLVTLFEEDFELGLGNWTITNLGGTCDWNVWDDITWESLSLPELPGGTTGQWLGANSDGCGSGTTMNTEIKMNSGIDCSLYQTVTLSYDSDFRVFIDDIGELDISTDGGTSWTNLRTLQGVSVRNEQVLYSNISSYAALQSDVRLRMVYQGAYDYWWCLDNMIIEGSDIVPVELTSFTANASEGLVELSWTTATELNNQGFEIQRNSGNDYQTVGFIDGHGTTTQAQEYSFTDVVTPGSYSYRLKQIDLDGSFEYSDVLEVDVTVPDVFALEQNYPNPFNPSTKIDFSLAVDSKVSLKVFDVLGQEVVTLINYDLGAGAHVVDFNASSLNSGVYFYRIDAAGIDGTNFTNVKKMIFTK